MGCLVGAPGKSSVGKLTRGAVAKRIERMSDLIREDRTIGPRNNLVPTELGVRVKAVVPPGEPT